MCIITRHCKPADTDSLLVYLYEPKIVEHFAVGELLSNTVGLVPACQLPNMLTIENHKHTTKMTMTDAEVQVWHESCQRQDSGNYQPQYAAQYTVTTMLSN